MSLFTLITACTGSDFRIYTMKLIALLISLVSAAAFAPVARVARSSSLKMGFESEIGAQPPLGFWDPLGLLQGADQERFDYLRSAELKHGRVAMLAVLGHKAAARPPSARRRRSS